MDKINKDYTVSLLWIYVAAVALYCLRVYTFEIPSALYGESYMRYGLNSFIIWTGFLALFVAAMRPLQLQRQKSALLWMAPLMLISASLFLYDNTFTTGISIVLLPFAFFLFSTHEVHSAKRGYIWSLFLPISAALSIAQVLKSIFSTPKALASRRLNIPVKASKNAITQAVIGVLVLVIVSSVFFIPLLSSADAAFGDIFSGFLEFIQNIQLSDEVWKFILALFFAFLFAGLALYWRTCNKNFTDEAHVKPDYSKEGIAINIVILGITALYVIFITIQASYYFSSELPIDFTQTEKMVKSGFWQLFVLTVINVVMVSLFYGRVALSTTRTLTIFAVSSLLLVFSALNRVWLYVVNYGLSHEKFFALFTAAFCAVLFVGIIMILMRKKPVRTPLFFIITLLSLWSYAVVVCLPIDRIIVATNLSLTQNEGSKIDINELTSDIGPDALAYVEQNYQFIEEIALQDKISATQFSRTKDAEHESAGFEVGDVAQGTLEPVSPAKEQELRSQVRESWATWIHYNRSISQSKSFMQNSLTSLRYSSVVDLQELVKPSQQSFEDRETGISLLYTHPWQKVSQNTIYNKYLGGTSVLYTLSHDASREMLPELFSQDSTDKSDEQQICSQQDIQSGENCYAQQSIYIELIKFPTSGQRDAALKSDQVEQGKVRNNNGFNTVAALYYEKLLREGTEQVGDAFVPPASLGDFRYGGVRELPNKSTPSHEMVAISDTAILILTTDKRVTIPQGQRGGWSEAISALSTDQSLVDALNSLRVVTPSV